MREGHDLRMDQVMKPLMFIIAVYFFSSCSQQSQNPKEKAAADTIIADPLPSWKEGGLKESILTYIRSVTDSSSKDFIPVNHRIATFGNNGTLWAERPLVQDLFSRYMVKKLVEKNPALAKQQPYKAVLENDHSYFEKEEGMKSSLEMLAAAYTNMTEEEFESSVKDF